MCRPGWCLELPLGSLRTVVQGQGELRRATWHEGGGRQHRQCWAARKQGERYTCHTVGCSRRMSASGSVGASSCGARRLSRQNREHRGTRGCALGKAIAEEGTHLTPEGNLVVDALPLQGLLPPQCLLIRHQTPGSVNSTGPPPVHLSPFPRPAQRAGGGCCQAQ